MGTYSERHIGGHEQGIKVVRGEFHADVVEECKNRLASDD